MQKVLVIDEVLDKDDLACRIAHKYVEWEMLRAAKISEWKEIQQYLFATDTTSTRNSSLPWANKTTVPKMCQIRDNLHANYMAALFPKRKWMIWEGSKEADEDKSKRKSIEGYMNWVIDRNEFYGTVSKIVYDYIDYGNAIAMPVWSSGTYTSEGGEKVGYTGPSAMRISPLDIVFNPTSTDFASSPKIIRSFVNLGELKEIIDSEVANEEDKESAEKLYNYLLGVRNKVAEHKGNIEARDNAFSISGFTDFKQYLQSDTVEVLTFYGDIYDGTSYRKNRIIKIVDRHKVICDDENPSFFGQAPIYHAGWRIRPDNLWAMGPLDNLVGMQYRIDHLENMKADILNIIAQPMLKIKGYVEDFTWEPMGRIYVGDDGDVTIMAPDTQALQADNQIAILEAKMEEMAGSPKEAMGFRTPGEKTAFEVQRLELAAGRIFQAKIAQFEREIVEPLVNSMLELARRNMTTSVVRIFDDESKLAIFKDLSVADITGQGRIRPVAARHFAEKANQVQTLNTFMGSPAAQSVAMHFSTIEMARMWENLLDLESYKIVEPFITLTEQADAQRLQNTIQQQVASEAMVPAGVLPGDSEDAFEESTLQPQV